MKQALLEKLANSEQFDRLFKQSVATAVSSRRYEMLVSDEISDPEQILSELEDGAVLTQDNNCKLVYLENPLQIFASGEWLDELNPVEAEVLRRLADGEEVSLVELKQLIADVEEQTSAMEILLDSVCNWVDDGWVLLG